MNSFIRAYVGNAAGQGGFYPRKGYKQKLLLS